MAENVCKSSPAATTKASEEKSASTAAKFKWGNERIAELIESLIEFKATMEFNNFDFDADKPRQYKEEF